MNAFVTEFEYLHTCVILKNKTISFPHILWFLCSLFKIKYEYEQHQTVSYKTFFKWRRNWSWNSTISQLDNKPWYAIFCFHFRYLGRKWKWKCAISAGSAARTTRRRFLFFYASIVRGWKIELWMVPRYLK